MYAHSDALDNSIFKYIISESTVYMFVLCTIRNVSNLCSYFRFFTGYEIEKTPTGSVKIIVRGSKYVSLVDISEFIVSKLSVQK